RGIRDPAVGIISDQILGAQFFADLAESLIQRGNAFGIIIFASGILGQLNQGMFAAQVSSCIGGHWHNNDAVNQGFGLHGTTEGVLIAGLAGSVTTICDKYQDLSAFAVDEGFGCQKNSIEHRGARASVETVNALFDDPGIGGKSGKLIY